MKHIIINLLITSFVFCAEYITQITDIYPDGTPKAITIFSVNTDFSYDIPLSPVQRYFYDQNGILTKYQEWYKNRTKSRELLIQRGYVVERSWDKQGFPGKTNKHELQYFSFPKKKSEKKTIDNKSIRSSIKTINSTINNMSVELDGLYKTTKNINANIERLNSEAASFDKRVDEEMSLQEETLKAEINHSNAKINTIKVELYETLNLLEGKLSSLENDLKVITDDEDGINPADYKNWKKSTNRKIENIKQDLRVLNNEVRQIRREIE